VAARRGRGKLHVVLLAGGSGTRFWPLSRAKRPKQLLALGGPESLLATTWRRARRLAPAERIWAVAPRRLAREVRAALPELGRSRLILEPTPRDTGPAVGLACATVARRDPGAIVALLPTDQVVRDVAQFVRCVRLAADDARAGALVCLGVRPDRPATSFGYLRCAERPAPGRSVRVARFVEKPDLSRARRFLRSGKYLWNAGMFVWDATVFLEQLERAAPRIRRAVDRCLAGRPEAWASAPRLSVDYAVMEQARGVRVVPLDAGWDDVGSWDAAARLREEQGRRDRDAILIDSPGSVVFAEGKTVAVVDLPGIAVVETPDALLVVARDSSERVREVVERLRRRGRKDLL